MINSTANKQVKRGEFKEQGKGAQGGRRVCGGRTAHVPGADKDTEISVTEGFAGDRENRSGWTDSGLEDNGWMWS